MWKDADGRTRLKQSGYLITGEVYEQTIRMAADRAPEKDRKAVEEYRRTWYLQIGDRGDYIKKHYEAPVIVQRLANILPDDAVIAYKSAQGDGQDGDKIAPRDEDEPMQETYLHSDMDLNTILFGPPGTGKTYCTMLYAVAICNRVDVESVKEGWEINAIKDEYNLMQNAGRIVFITFHQSYEYSDFIEGIKPKPLRGGVTYEVEPGVFRKFCAEAKGKKVPYVFIIDEINRGNISKIFGELITLIEPSKRETQKVTLPLTPEQEFTVPKNVYILGTMNTADRSIAMMDTALRRRFDFVQMAPQPELLPKNVEGVDVAKMLEVMNERIEWLYDADHAIGHALFWTLHEKPSLEELARIFRKKIIPQLQEYFHDDYGKVRLVLGESPMIECEPKPGDDLFPGADGLDLPEAIYRVAEADKAVWKDTGTYKKIYK